MPAGDVSDLRDVVDAINKLCDTMKTSYDDVVLCEADEGLVEPAEVVVRRVEIHVAERWCAPAPEDESGDFYSDPGTVEPAYDSEPTTMAPLTYDSRPVAMQVAYDSEQAGLPMVCDTEPATMLPVTGDTKLATVAPVTREFESTTVEPVAFETEPAPCEPTSEMYYTASSEVSLVSDTDFQERAQSEESDRESGRDDRNSVMAGHVAAMRERFESMTRTNTPCPDLIRSTSPSFEVFRNVSTSPDIEKS